MVHLGSFLRATFCTANCICLLEQIEFRGQQLFFVIYWTPPSVSTVRCNISSCAGEGIHRPALPLGNKHFLCLSVGGRLDGGWALHLNTTSWLTARCISPGATAERCAQLWVGRRSVGVPRAGLWGGWGCPFNLLIALWQSTSGRYHTLRWPPAQKIDGVVLQRRAFLLGKQETQAQMKDNIWSWWRVTWVGSCSIPRDIHKKRDSDHAPCLTVARLSFAHNQVQTHNRTSIETLLSVPNSSLSLSFSLSS